MTLLQGRALNVDNLSSSLANPLFYDFMAFLEGFLEKEKGPQVKSSRLGTRMF